MTAPRPRNTLAFSYQRYSSPAQGDGDSVRRQTALRDAWLSRHPDVRLDLSAAYCDRGKSGYNGKHRETGVLREFLADVEAGAIPRGSVLLIENMDRLSREPPVAAVHLLTGLLLAGIRVVQLSPDEIELTAESDLFSLLRGQMSQARGHDESKMKSARLGATWANKKRRAREDRTAHGNAIPAWIELTAAGYQVRPEAAAAVRLLFQWSAEGLGTLAIAQRLRAEKIPPIGRAPQWHRSYVAKILTNPAVLGEYQPMRGHHPRVKDGDPVPNYFPAVITPALWYAAHKAKDARNKRSGRPGRKGDFVYPFSGMVFCALDSTATKKCPLHVITRKGKRYLVSARAATGEKDAHWRPFPVEVFSEAVLSMLKELKAADLFSNPGAGKVAEIDGRLADLERRLAVALRRFEEDPDSPTWADAVGRYDKDKQALLKERIKAKQEAIHPTSVAWEEAVALMARQDPRRLRAALLATVEGIHCVIVARGHTRLLAAQVYFKDSDQCRDYLVIFRGGTSGAAGEKPAEWWVRSLSEIAAPGALDLRKPTHARRLEKVLAVLELE